MRPRLDSQIFPHPKRQGCFMLATRWFLPRLNRRPRPQSAARRRAPQRPASLRLFLEPLEDRTLLSFSNVLVSNVAADTGSNDTQSETSLVLAGSTVVVGFNDSERSEE